MRERRRPRLTYANVTSTIALMLALGGTSYAAFNLPNNSVTSSKIKNGAVHSQDLANNAVTNSKIANAAVTGPKLAAAAITEANVAPGSLTGAAFKCGPGDEALDNRDECFFKVSNGGMTWTQAVSMCRARGSTPATLASPAEVAAAAPLGGSPFTTGTFWTSQFDTGGQTGGPSPTATAFAVEVLDGSVVDLLSTPVGQNTIGAAACVYHAADVF